MKIAALSDIHGNIAALDAVLEDIDRRRPDVIVNLGDILSGPLFPAETADRLMSLNLPTISGNHERQVLTLPDKEMGPTDRFTLARLNAEHRAWLQSLPETLRLSDDVLLVHGSPRSDMEYFMETVTPEGVRPATINEIESRLGGADAPVILCGHTHIARLVRTRAGGLIVNPGSVGLPAYSDDRPFPHSVENGAPHARYAMLTGGKDSWSVEFLAVAYDWDSAAQAAEDNDRPDWARAVRSGFC